MATRVAQGLLDMDSQTGPILTSTVGVVQSRICGAVGLHHDSGVFPGTTVDAGTLLSLSIESFAYHN
jgi:hypothetical protein